MWNCTSRDPLCHSCDRKCGLGKTYRESLYINGRWATTHSEVCTFQAHARLSWHIGACQRLLKDQAWFWHGVQACLNVCLTSGPNIDAMREDCIIAISLGSMILARSEAHEATTKMHSRGLRNGIPWRLILTRTFSQVYMTDSATVLIALANSHYNVSWEATHTSHTLSAIVKFGRRHIIATCNKTLFYCERIAH